MKIESMPNRISMNVTVPKQTQGKNFGEKVSDGLTSGAALLNQGASLLGGALGSPVISAAVSSVTGLANSSASAASYAATGIVGYNGGSTSASPQNITVGAGNGSGPNLTAGAGTNAGSYNTDIASMSAQNAQMLQVQMAMQRENTMFSSISNVLKTKHDTAKNSISNIR